MIDFLRELQDDEPFLLRGCNGATLLLHFTRKVANPQKLAKRLISLDADEYGVLEDGIVQQAESLKEFAKLLGRRRPISRLWWD